MVQDDIVRFSYTVEDSPDLIDNIAFDLKMTEEQANKVVHQQCRVIKVVNNGSHIIAGYLDGSKELLPIDMVEKVG